ncbi:MAG: NUDIX domain-containing protein, partial [Rhodospirillales bacterium]|nr:NUDIX domain-containing protein [Rhodospirillales bacterium]
KGMAEPGEPSSNAAARELEEETGLIVAPDVLVSLGRHRYLPGKDLALFAWDDALARVGKNLARVLAEVRPCL